MQPYPDSIPGISCSYAAVVFSRSNRSAAARAATHFLISKSGSTDRVATGIAEMDRPARQEEIARMLAGATITDEARAAAERLLRENTTAA